jgi:gp16 family phage-associated protein
MSRRVGHKLKSPARVRQEFVRAGVTISQWARDNGFKPNLVLEVLAGRSRGRYGKSHRIAVLLGLKRGGSEAGLEA